MKKRSLLLILAAGFVALTGCAGEEAEAATSDNDIMRAFLLEIDGKEYQYEGDRTMFDGTDFDWSPEALVTELEDGSKIYRAQDARGYEVVVQTNEVGNQSVPYFAAWSNFETGPEALAFYGAPSSEGIVSYEVSKWEGSEQKGYLQSDDRAEIAGLYDILCRMENGFVSTESYTEEEVSGVVETEPDGAFSAWYAELRWISLKLESGLVLTIQFSETDREAYIFPAGTGFGVKLSEEQLAFLKEIISQ